MITQPRDNRDEHALDAALAAATVELEKWQGRLVEAVEFDDDTGEAENRICELEREIEELEELLG
jgi:hypothetical protein